MPAHLIPNVAAIDFGPWAPGLAAGGASAVLFAAFAMVLRHLLTTFSKQQRAQTHAIESLTATVIGLQEMLLQHDATVRGINPSVGEDAEERAKEATAHYKALLRLMKEQRRAVLGRLIPYGFQEPRIEGS